MLTQVIIDLFKNKLIKVYTETGGGTIIKDVNEPLVNKGMVKFYPTGAMEKITYETTDLVNEARIDPKLGSGKNTTFI
jgi:hypothetical protein